MDLVIQIDSVKYSIPPSGYLLDVFGNPNASCVLAVGSIPESYGVILLGDTFIRNFYTVFNYSAPYSVSFASTAYAPTFAYPTVPGNDVTLPVWAIALIAVSILALFLIGTLVAAKKNQCCCFGSND
jgi:hypothetical protein